MKMFPLQACKLARPAKRPIKRHQETPKRRSSTTSIFGIGCPQEQPKLVVRKKSLPLARLRFANPAKSMRWNESSFHAPIEATLNRSKDNSLGRGAKRFERSTKASDVLRLDRVSGPHSKFIDELLARVFVRLVGSLLQILFRVIDERLAKRRYGNGAVHVGKQRLLFEKFAEPLSCKRLVLLAFGKHATSAADVTAPSALLLIPPDFGLTSHDRAS
jgi:hypothetical protein